MKQLITEQEEKKIILKIQSAKKLYHGSDQRFHKIDLDFARPFKDFGKGFYLTTEVRQARKWAQNKGTRKAKAYIYSYRLNIKENLEKLQWSDAADQYCFKTDRAISLLTLDQIYVLSKNEKGLWTKPKLLVEEGRGGA